MAEQIQCDNCGASLAPEDAFCGECGAPRPSLVEASGLGQGAPVLETRPPALPPPPPRPASRTTSAPQTNWRVAYILLLALGAMACVAALAAFFVFASIGGEDLTPQENWLMSALCCLLPIGGIGALLLAAGGLVWYARLKDR